MNNSPAISVIITVYNRENFLEEAIRSVLNSSFRDFELIISDDGSTDHSYKIAQKYLSQDDRIRLYRNDKNLGDYPHRNKAASYANGKYLKFVDSDDFIFPETLELMYKAMAEFPEAGYGMTGPVLQTSMRVPYLFTPGEAYEYHYFGPGLFVVGPSSAIIRNEAFKKEGGFLEERMTSDSDMWCRLSLKYPTVLMQQGLIHIRVHPEQELTDKSKYLIQGEKLKWKYLLADNAALTKDQVEKIRVAHLKKYTRFMLSGLKNFNFSQAENYWKCLLFLIKVKV